MNRLIYLTIIVASLICTGATKPIIKMGYRTTNKLPYIEEAPSNEGLYKDLYSEACRRIGCELEIVRLPKKRILIALEEGELDFYPGFAFNKERAKYAFWFRNGLQQRDIAISLDTLHDLKTYDDLKGLRYLAALGNPDYFEGDIPESLRVFTVAELDIERALKMLSLHRADFYIYEEDTMKFWVKSRNITGFKFHPELIKRFYWMYVGFSRLSPHFQQVANSKYDSTREMSATNFPYEVKEGSVVDQLRDALWEMHEEGYSDSLYNVYFE